MFITFLLEVCKRKFKLYVNVQTQIRWLDWLKISFVKIED